MPLEVSKLAELIHSQAGSLLLWIRSRSSAGEDVVQEAFCRLSVQEPTPANPVAWLYLVCRNLAEKERLSSRRRKSREAARAQPEAAHQDPAGRLELGEALTAVERLDDQLREVLVARIWGGLSFEEIGELCGISTATSFRRYQEAIKTLQAKLVMPCENDH